MDVRGAIERGDVMALQALLAADGSRANALIRWGEDGELLSHPIHFVCDRLFDGTLPAGEGAPLVRALVAAGADVDFADGDPLNAAVSLGAPDVVDVLLDAGARVDGRGLLGETALHWAAYTGAEGVVRRLVEQGAPVDVRDGRWSATPLGWALHGWNEPPPPANQARHAAVVAYLVRVGAVVEPGWLESARERGRPEVLAALSGGAGDAP